MKRLAGLALSLLVAACNQAPETVADEATPAPPVAPVSTPEAWVGRWTGPEGLFLDIAHKQGAAYELTLKDNLDSQAVYDAEADGATLRFTRAGVVRTIRPGVGAETGFKHLADKTDCLIVIPNTEGYCRD